MSLFSAPEQPSPTKINPAAAPFFHRGATGGVGVVLIHGLTASPTEVRPIADDLLDRDPSFTISCPLLPGHGTTPQELRRVRIDAWERAVTVEIDRLSQWCESISVMGVSLGGVLAAQAAQRDSRVASVGMLAPVFGFPWRTSMLISIARWFVPYIRKNPVSLENHRRKGICSYGCFPLHALARLEKLGGRVRRRLGTITTPTIIAAGRLDRYVSFDGIRSICVEMGASDVSFIDCRESGHVLPYEPDAPKIFAAIHAFLDKHHGTAK